MKIVSSIEASSGVNVVVSAVNPDIRPAVGICKAADIKVAKVTLPKGRKQLDVSFLLIHLYINL